MEKENLAMELLREIKQNAKRWFIIAIVELVILIVSNLAWLGYINQYETVTSEEQLMEDIDNSNNSSYVQTIN